MDTHFERELARRLRELKDNRTTVLTQNVLTREEYLIQMGYFQCLQAMETLCDEIRADLRS